MFNNQYSGRRVLVTGHTGFKGSWLVTWLLGLGADVAGYSIDVPTSPSHFEAIRLKERIRHFDGDIRDRHRLNSVLDDFEPQVVFHLAAQSLVRRSYADPVRTFEVNALGTLNVLESLRSHPQVCAAVIITSDKCYENSEWIWGYRESDRLGGDDPYSGSKACAELIFHSYARSFLNDAATAGVASARAGNVIGGGDWASDRIVPDCARAWSTGVSVPIRNPHATRPWQHVLEPISGYLWLAAHLLSGRGLSGSSFNFGPDAAVNQSVEALIAAMASHWQNAAWHFDAGDSHAKHESMLLKLCCDKALAELQWQPALSFLDTVRLTAQWYQRFYSNREANLFDLSQSQIAEYCALARERKISWSLA